MFAHRPVQGLAGDSVRDTIAAVFRQRTYDRTILPTLIGRVWDGITDWLHSLLTAIGHSGPVRVVVYILLATMLVAVIIRIAILGTAAGVGFRRGGGLGGRGGPQDPWGDADRLANAGQYTDAAHALYRGLLDSIARREQIQLHHSKTVGDYGRDLRRRSSTLAPPYRDFARSYETVVYGLGTCDRARYDRLHALATDMVRSAA
jgi:hypothetical protein